MPLQFDIRKTLFIPVKASGGTKVGELWLDTTDNYLHFYALAGGSEVKITGCVYA